MYGYTYYIYTSVYTHADKYTHVSICLVCMCVYARRV